MSAQAHDDHRTLREGGKKFQARVMNRNVFRVYMMVKMPPLGVTGAYLEHLELERCVFVLPNGWATQDMFGRMPVGVMTAAAELASASLWVINIRNQGAGLTPVPVSVTFEAEQPITERLRFRCLSGDQYPDAVLRAARGEQVTQEVEVEGVTEGNAHACKVTLRWRLDVKS